MADQIKPVTTTWPIRPGDERNRGERKPPRKKAPDESSVPSSESIPPEQGDQQHIDTYV